MDFRSSLDTEGRKWAFSIIGHSLGGLYARHCIGELYKLNFFEDFLPIVRAATFIYRHVDQWTKFLYELILFLYNH